jgi:hypothetical protein
MGATTKHVKMCDNCGKFDAEIYMVKSDEFYLCSECKPNKLPEIKSNKKYPISGKLIRKLLDVCGCAPTGNPNTAINLGIKVIKELTNNAYRKNKNK